MTKLKRIVGLVVLLASPLLSVQSHCTKADQEQKPTPTVQQTAEVTTGPDQQNLPDMIDHVLGQSDAILIP